MHLRSPHAGLRRRPAATLAVAGVTVALVLSACGNSSTSPGSSTSPSGSAAAGAGGKPTFKVGLQGPLSGDNAQLGINVQLAVKTAIDEANAKGDLPFTLAQRDSDDMGLPDQGPTASQKLVDDSGVVAVVGPIFSGATKASEPNFSQAGLLSVTPSATNPALTTLGFKTFYRFIATDAVQGQGAADFLVKGPLKAKKVFSLDDKSEYGTGLSKSLEGQLTADGATFTHDGINPTKDYTAIASRVARGNLTPGLPRNGA